MNLENLTTPGEILGYGLVIVLEGILVVFLVLTLIMFVIDAMSLFSGEKKSKAAIQPDIPQPAKEEDAIIDETELIAVLTAAVAACIGQSAASVNIKSYKKVSRAWGNAAKQETLNNKI